MSTPKSISHTRINGISTVLPKNKVYNTEISWIPDPLKQRLIETIGINERHIVDENARLADYAIHAAKDLIHQTNTAVSDVGLIVLVTQTGDQQLPNTVIKIQSGLELSEDSLALEVNMGCAGFVHGLYLVGNLLQQLQQPHAILICGDFSSRLLSARDTGTVPLFSDAVSATLLSRSPSELWRFQLYNNAADNDAISMQVIEKAEAYEKAMYYLKLDGHKILNFGLKSVVPGIQQFLRETDVASIDYYFFHQASRIINSAIREKLNISEDKCPMSLNAYGNTSSATIPLTMCNTPGLKAKKNNLLLCGFGTGLSWGVAQFSCEPIDYLGIDEI